MNVVRKFNVYKSYSHNYCTLETKVHSGCNSHCLKTNYMYKVECMTKIVIISHWIWEKVGY